MALRHQPWGCGKGPALFLLLQPLFTDIIRRGTASLSPARRLSTLSSWGLEGPVPDLGRWVKHIHLPPGRQLGRSMDIMDSPSWILIPTIWEMVGNCGNPQESPGHLWGLPEVQEALTSPLPQGEEAGDAGESHLVLKQEIKARLCSALETQSKLSSALMSRRGAAAGGWEGSCRVQGWQEALPDLLPWPPWASPVPEDSSECFQAGQKGKTSGLLLEVTPVTPVTRLHPRSMHGSA